MVLEMLSQTPVDWFSKHQNQVEMATDGSKFVAAQIRCKHLIDLRCALQSFGMIHSFLFLLMTWGDSEKVLWLTNQNALFGRHAAAKDQACNPSSSHEHAPTIACTAANSQMCSLKSAAVSVWALAQAAIQTQTEIERQKLTKTQKCCVCIMNVNSKQQFSVLHAQLFKIVVQPTLQLRHLVHAQMQHTAFIMLSQLKQFS